MQWRFYNYCDHRRLRTVFGKSSWGGGGLGKERASKLVSGTYLKHTDDYLLVHLDNFVEHSIYYVII